MLYKGSVAFSAGRGYRGGVRNLAVMVESLSGGSRQEIQEEGRVLFSTGQTCYGAENFFV